MGHFVKIVGNDIYFRLVCAEAHFALENWLINNGYDAYLKLKCPIGPDIFEIKSTRYYNMRRMASQLGSVLARSSSYQEPVITRERK